MPMCACDCTCRPCKISEMAYHPLFSERLDAMVAEWEKVVPPKPRRNLLPMDDESIDDDEY